MTKFREKAPRKIIKSIKAGYSKLLRLLILIIVEQIFKFCVNLLKVAHRITASIFLSTHFIRISPIYHHCCTFEDSLIKFFINARIKLILGLWCPFFFFFLVDLISISARICVIILRQSMQFFFLFRHCLIKCQIFFNIGFATSTNEYNVGKFFPSEFSAPKI